MKRLALLLVLMGIVQIAYGTYFARGPIVIQEAAVIGIVRPSEDENRALSKCFEKLREQWLVLSCFGVANLLSGGALLALNRKIPQPTS